MKKLMVLMMVVSLLTLAGCGDSEKVIEGGAADPASSSVETEETSGAPQESENEVQVKGYVFEFQDAVAVVDADVTTVTDVLGEPLSYYEAASCAFNGLDKIFTYSGFNIETYPQDDADYISGIILKDDSVATPEGVSIGDTREKVEEAYGTEYADENGMLVYEKDGMKLCFILQEDEVISVEYRSTVLDE